MTASDGKSTNRRRTARPQPDAAAVRAEVAGHVVEVRSASDRPEQLWIDGEQRQFFVTSAGYHLLDDAYRPAEESLLAAATKHLERLARSSPRAKK